MNDIDNNQHKCLNYHYISLTQEIDSGFFMHVTPLRDFQAAIKSGFFMGVFMPAITVVGLEEVQQLIEDMPEVGKKTLATSINRTVTHLKSVVSQTVRTFSTVKAKYAKSSMIVPKKARVNSLNSSLVITGKRIPLIGYQARQTKKGVNARIFKAGELKLRPRAFIATMKNGHKGVFWRKYARGDKLVGRLSITELTDLSIPELVNDSRVWEDLQDEADETLQKELDKNYQYYTNKYR